jgi:CRISPR-associated protein Csb2
LKAKADISETVMRSLLGTLAHPPRFQLPPATTGHTRHFMPYNEGKNTKTTKIFDTFIQMADDAALLVAWDVDLPLEERAALKILAERLCFFGRAEALVVGRLLEEGYAFQANAEPLKDQEPLPQGKELIRLLAPMSSARYHCWRLEFAAQNQPPLARVKKTGKRSSVEGSIPPDDLFAALHADTGWLQDAGWNLPPGAVFVNYARPVNAIAPATAPRPRPKGHLPTVARFALAGVVPPAITKALAVGEQIHAVLCKESNGHPIFTGMGAKGHQHAHVFCESIGDTNAHITHVTVFAPEGFDNEALQALRRIQWTWGFRGHELRTVLQGIGEPQDFDSPLFDTAKAWRSLTPFVSTRHAKTFRDGRPKMASSGWQEGSPPHDLLRLLALNPKLRGATIRRQLPERGLPFEFGSRRFRSLQFQTLRRVGNGRRGNDGGAAFVVEFPEPVNGPIALGYAAHFGLGLFVPVPE